MKEQRGSVLVGVIALSLVMTVGAGGLILMSGNAARDQQANAENQSLHYAAESGMYLGVRWMRTKDSTFHNAGWAESCVLTQGTDGYSTIAGIPVRVSIQGTPGGPGIRILKSIATRGAGKDTLQLTWRVDRVNNVNEGGSLPHCKPVLSHWLETFRPGR